MDSTLSRLSSDSGNSEKSALDDLRGLTGLFCMSKTEIYQGAKPQSFVN